MLIIIKKMQLNLRKLKPFFYLYIGISFSRWRGTGLHISFFVRAFTFLPSERLYIALMYLFHFPTPQPPLPSLLLQQLQPEEKESQNITSYLALVNLKEISLPWYKSGKIKVSEMNKLKLP